MHYFLIERRRHFYSPCCCVWWVCALCVCDVGCWNCYFVCVCLPCPCFSHLKFGVDWMIVTDSCVNEMQLQVKPHLFSPHLRTYERVTC